MGWVWVLIPLAAILVGAFSEWLKFNEKQNRMGASTRELGNTISSLRASIEELESERDALVGRVRNLEAIVTSQVWDEAHDRPSERFLDAGLDTGFSDERDPRLDERTDAETVAKMARRLNR